MTETSDLNINKENLRLKKEGLHIITQHILCKKSNIYIILSSKRMESIRENILNITGNYGNEHFTADCRSQQEKGKKYILQMQINFHII